MVDLFPGYNFNLRGSAYRSDSVTPLGPNKVLIEFRVAMACGRTQKKKDRHVSNIITLYGDRLVETYMKT